MNILDTAGLQVYYAPDSHCLYNTWRGTHDAASIREHSSFIVSCLRAHECRSLLSDHQQMGSYHTSHMYAVLLANLARLAAFGVQRIAWVPPTHTQRGQDLLERTCQSIMQVRIKVFVSTDAAQAWLNQE